MVLEYFGGLKSRFLWKILSKKVRHVSVAQLVHEISLKASKIDFFNFHDFVSFFTNFFHPNILFKKMFSGVFSFTIASKKDQKNQNICELVIFDEAKYYFQWFGCHKSFET